jgi:hypothetical protein
MIDRAVEAYNEVLKTDSGNESARAGVARLRPAPAN